MAQILAEDAAVLTLTGHWAEGRDAAETAFAAEFSGTFSRSRLVGGKANLRRIGPGAAILHQRFVLLGALDVDGRELPRFSAMLTAFLVARTEGWQALSLTFSPLSE